MKRHLALAALASTACVFDSLPVGMLDGTTGTETESPTSSVPEPTETSGATSRAEATGDESTSGETGDDVDLCPGPSGWQWTDRRGTANGDEKYTRVDAFADGVVAEGEVQEAVSMVRRYDVSGQLQWEREGRRGWIAEDIRALPDGDVLVCGFAHQPVPALWLTRLDSMGNEEWSVDAPNLRCRTVDVTAAGDIVVGGVLDGHKEPEGETAVLRFDAEGTLLGSWTADVSLAFGIMYMATVGEDVVMLAEDNATNGFWLGRLDANDQLVWGESHFDPILHLEPLGVTVDAATGDIVVVGYTDVSFLEPNDLAAWRFSADGTLQWSVEHDLANESEEAYAARIAPDGTIVIAGAVQQGGIYQPLVAALEPDGALAWWTFAEEDGGQVVGTDVALDDCGAIYVAGWGNLGQPSYDAWVGRYVPPGGS